MFTFVEIALSVGVLVTLVSAIAACVCGCKNSNQKSELVGTAGVVKLRLEEEAPSPVPTTPASVKRASTQNSQRSLPEIPHPVGRHDSGDTASEIYATVNLDEGNKVAAVASTSREHPYEHAYAKLQNQNDAHNVGIEMPVDQVSVPEIQIDERDGAAPAPGLESVVISASVAISGQLPSSQELPYITPPSPRDNNVHFSGDSTDSAKGYTSISVREPLSTIRAQSIKPPTPHYATVSDDSDEMYAAIEEASVGEGSDTYAQITPEPRRTRAHAHVPELVLVETHARRSAPPEVGASTSNATHSRQASSSSCSNSTGALGSPKPEKRSANSPLPPPPPPPHPAHPSHPTHPSRAPPVENKHQRISSTGDLFSNDKLRRSLNEKHQRNNSCVSSSDFYGCNYPVDKHRFSSGDIIRPLQAKEINFDLNQTNDNDNLYNSIDAPPYSDYSSDPNTTANSEQRITESPSRNVEEMYAKVIKRKAKDEARKSKEYTNNDVNATTYRTDDPGYETIDRKKSHGYETITHKERKMSNQDPGYESVKDIKTNTFNNNVNLLNHLSDSGPNSIISSDPGYEHISKTDHNASDSDPNYEVLRNEPPTPPYDTIQPNYKIQPTYSTVNKHPSKYNNWQSDDNDNDATLEPNYESMPHDPLYTTGSESDPNYESVRPKDPNYETLGSQDPNYESLRCRDPKYESVRSKDSRRTNDPNYESVKYFDVNKKEPPYEKVGNDTGPGSSIDRSDSAAGYEKINVPNRNQNNSINGADAPAPVSDYFQV